MKNPNWYYHCDLKNFTALEYRQLPEFYGNMGSVHDLTDETLADLSFVVENRGFLREGDAVLKGIDSETMRTAREAARAFVLSILRDQRDHLLMLTDQAAASDRWEKMDAVSKRKVGVFRQALRDITTQDIFNVVWPQLPLELNTIRNYGWPEDIVLSEGLQDMLDAPSPEETFEEIQEDQWQRIQDIRDGRIGGGVEVDGKWYYTDGESKTRYLSLVIAGPALMPPNIEWKTMDGSKVIMSHALALRIYIKAMEMTNVIYQYGEALKYDLYQATEPAQFNITVGWPQVYADTIVS